MSIRTMTGDCLVRVDGRRERTVRGRILVIIKPDNTVLVHDIDGYQPVAWLTRPENLSVTHEPLWLVASDGDETLRIEAVGELTVADHDATDAGTPVGTCRCDGELVRTGNDVVCLECDDRFGLPSGASMTDSAVFLPTRVNSFCRNPETEWESVAASIFRTVPSSTP